MDKVQKVMREFKAGTLRSPSGKRIKDAKQALAIALSYTKKKRRRKK